LIVVPMITLTVLYGLAAIQSKYQKGVGQAYFSVFDISALLGLFLISMAVGVQSFSRMGMFCFPLYLPLAVVYVSQIVSELDSQPSSPAP